MSEWPKSRLIAAQYQSPFFDGIGFAQYASTGTVTPDLRKNITRIESDAAQNPGDPAVEGWAADMVALRAALTEEGVTLPLTEDEALKVLTVAAESWASELTEYIIPADEDTDPETTANRREQVDRIHEAIKLLTPKEKQ